MLILTEEKTSSITIKMEDGEGATFDILSEGRFWFDIQKELEETAKKYIKSRSFPDRFAFEAEEPIFRTDDIIKKTLETMARMQKDLVQTINEHGEDDYATPEHLRN